MTTVAWDRVGAASGIVSIALSIGGFAIIGVSGLAVTPGGPMEDVEKAITEGNASLALFGLTLDTLGSLFFIAFAARLWATLREAEPAPAWLAVTALGSALVAVTAGLGDKAAFFAIFLRAEEGLAADIAASMYDTAGAYFVLFRSFAGFFLVAAGLSGLRAGGLLRWLAWAGVVIGLANIIEVATLEADVGQIAFPFFALWIVAASVVLLRRPLARTPA